VNTADPPTPAGRREWLGLAVLALPTLLLSLDFSVLFLALPHLGADLGASETQLLWIMDGYGFMVAGFLITMGTLGDRIGRRRLLMIGAAAFGAVSVLAAYATSAELLIVARLLLGIAGATQMPSTLALIGNMFRDPRQRGLAIGIWATCLLAGIAIGPVIGGVLLELFWWGSVFLMGVPVMVILLVAAPLLLPEYRAGRSGRLDLLSVGLSLAAILLTVYGLKELAKAGPHAAPLLAIAAGLAAGLVFVWRQRRVDTPLLDLRLFANRSFAAALAILLLAGSASGGVGFLFAQHLQRVLGLAPLPAGLWLVPYAAAMIVSSLLSPVLARRVRPGYVVAGGLAVAVLGFLVFTQVTAAGGLAVAVTGSVIMFFGIAPAWVLGTDLVVGSAPPERAGAASALSETSSELGVALGVAVFGSVAVAVSRSRLADGAPLEEALTGGLTAGAAIAAGAVAVLAGLAVVLLRHLRPTD
jgi:DHA2 family multidrug resistance protein-like MFS transporter